MAEWATHPDAPRSPPYRHRPPRAAVWRTCNRTRVYRNRTARRDAWPTPPQRGRATLRMLAHACRDLRSEYRALKSVRRIAAVVRGGGISVKMKNYSAHSIQWLDLRRESWAHRRAGQATTSENKPLQLPAPGGEPDITFLAWSSVSGSRVT